MTKPRRYRFDLACPRCGWLSEIMIENDVIPVHQTCKLCLARDDEKITLAIRKVEVLRG
jgi:hypothetical protein